MATHIVSFWQVRYVQYKERSLIPGRGFNQTLPFNLMLNQRRQAYHGVSKQIRAAELCRFTRGICFVIEAIAIWLLGEAQLAKTHKTYRQ